MNEGDRAGNQITRARSLRLRVYDVLERGSEHDSLSLTINRVISLFVVVNLLTMTLETVPSLNAQYGRLFFIFEMISLVVFTLEYAAIIWSAVEQPLQRHLSPWRSRLPLVVSPAGLADLIAVLPSWLALVVNFDLRILLVLRVVRFRPLARSSSAGGVRGGRPSPLSVSVANSHSYRTVSMVNRNALCDLRNVTV